MDPYDGKYEKLNKSQKSPRAITILLTLIFLVLSAQFSLTCYLTYEGYRIVEDSSDSLNSLKSMPVGEMTKYITETFYGVKMQTDLTPVEQTIQNVHDSSKKMRELIYAQEETSKNLKAFIQEASDHKALFKTTLQLALNLQAPLKGINNMGSDRNQDDLKGILHKVHSSLSKLEDNELNNLMLKGTVLAADVDKVIHRFEKTIDKLHNI